MRITVSDRDVFDEISDLMLIGEVERRGLEGEFTDYITEYVDCDCDCDCDGDPKVLDFDINIVYDCWKRGQKKEALILLERFLPDLVDISKLCD